MPATGSARRYAQAAFGIARERGEIDRWREDLRVLAELFSVPEMQAFVDASRVPLAEKQRVLDEHLATVQPLVRNLAHLLVRKGRVHQAEEVLQDFEEMTDNHRGVVSASVTTAVPLEPEQESRIREVLRRQEGRELRLLVRVDPEIIGGFVARVGDSVLDGSTRTRLREMRDRLRASALWEV